MTRELKKPVASPASHGSALTAFQRRALSLVSKGYGLSAAPRAMPAWQRREMQQLLDAGLVRLSNNHSKDKHGAYSAPNDQAERLAPANPRSEPVGGVVLSLFPGIGLLDRAFESEGFCVVRGPDVLWGGDVRRFHVPPGVFAGIIGGPPCQPFSQLVHIVRANGFEPRHENLIPEYERVVSEAQPQWWLMEEVPSAPLPSIEGYKVRSQVLNNRWCGGTQNRERRISFGTRDGRLLPVETVALDSMQWDFAVCGDSRRRPVKLGGSGKEKGGKTSSLNRGGGSMPLSEMCRLKGLPEGFLEESPFTSRAKRQMIGNGVPFALACALASAVRRAAGAGVWGTHAATQRKSPNEKLTEPLGAEPST